MTDQTPPDPSPDASEAGDSPEGLTLLGRAARGPIQHLETFARPEHCTLVRFTTDELTSVCPVTGQPDFSSLLIEYEPTDRCIESKSLKLYLWSFRDKGIFAEGLASEIAGEVMRATHAERVKIVVNQHVRGGIALEAVAELHGDR